MAGIFEADLVEYRELLDRAFMLESEDCPALQMLRDGKDVGSNSLVEWTAKALPGVNPWGIVEGAPVTTFDSTKRLTLSNYVQQFDQAWSVSDRANKIKSAGMEKATEAGEQAMDAMVLLRKQIEMQILSLSDAKVQAGQVPYTCRGMGSWISASAQTQLPVPATLRNASADIWTSTTALLTQDEFEAIINSCASERKGKVTLDLICAPLLKTKINSYVDFYPVASTTSQITAMYQKGNGRTFERMTDFLNFSGSTVRTHLSYYVGMDVSTDKVAVSTAYTNRGGYLINVKQWDIGWMDRPTPYTLPDDGSGPRGYCRAYMTLRCYDPRGQGRIWSAT
jgi:hypothetical protein